VAVFAKSSYRVLSEAQMKRYQLFRTGPHAKVRHLDCASAWLVDRLDLADVLDQVMRHQVVCNPVEPGLPAELPGQEALVDENELGS
jgi:hypothetical protein